MVVHFWKIPPIYNLLVINDALLLVRHPSLPSLLLEVNSLFVRFWQCFEFLHLAFVAATNILLVGCIVPMLDVELCKTVDVAVENGDGLEGWLLGLKIDWQLGPHDNRFIVGWGHVVVHLRIILLHMWWALILVPSG